MKTTTAATISVTVVVVRSLIPVSSATHGTTPPMLLNKIIPMMIDRGQPTGTPSVRRATNPKPAPSRTSRMKLRKSSKNELEGHVSPHP